MTGPKNPETPWPYDWLKAENQLEPRQIEEQGRFLLHRGLNIGRTIGFIGSGVSLAYGRVSWGELGLVVVEGIVAARKRASLGQALTGMVDRLEAMKDAVARGIGDDITLAMHLAERIFMLAGQEAPFTPPKSRTQAKTFSAQLVTAFNLSEEMREGLHEGLRGAELGRALFRKIIREETYDEVAHMRRLLSSARQIARGPESRADHADAVHDFAQSLSAHRLDRFRERSRNRRLREIFDEKLFAKQSGKGNNLFGQILHSRHSRTFEPSVVEFGRNLLSLIEGEFDGNVPVLRPQRWHAVALLIDIIRFLPAHRVRSRALGAIAQHLKKTRDQLEGRSGMRRMRERARIIPREHDPLWRLAFDLRISRFATLNFDLEIERLLQDEKYSPTLYPTQDHILPDHIERFGPLGGRARDFILTHNTIADFIDFATTDRPYEFQVVHLHGRATDGDDIVVTERDYQRTYIGNEPEHEAIGAGLEVMFGGNPILFAGVGLSEGDVLRPLREFAAGRTRRNRAIVVLRDATADRSTLGSYTVQQYVRYGVHTIHYGMRSDIDAGSQDHPWLSLLSEYCKSLRSLAAAMADERNSAADLTRLQSNLERHRERLESAVPSGKFESDGSKVDIDFELRLLRALDHFMTRVVKSRLMAPKHIEDRKAMFSIAANRAIDRSLGAAMTVALNARLESLRKEWTEWWREWRTPPLPRPAHFPLREIVGRLRPLSDRKRKFDPLYAMRHVRHVVIEASDDPKKDPPASAALSAFLRRIPSMPALPGRRLFVLSAPRGAGKGSLFAELTRHADWILERRPRSNAGEMPSQRYAGYFMASFSFSPQVNSVWDDLIGFLEARPDPADTVVTSWIPSEAAWNEPDDPRTQDKAANASERSGRADRLRRAVAALPHRLREMSAHLSNANVGAVVPRYLIVFNGFDLLFRQSGYPKNADIKTVCNILLQETTEAPLDFVVLFRDTIVPIYFKAPSKEKPYPSHLPRGCTFEILLSDEDLALQQRNGASGPHRAAERQSHITRVIERGGIAAAPPDRLPDHVFATALQELFQKRLCGHATPAAGNYLRVLHTAYRSDVENTDFDLVSSFDRYLRKRRKLYPNAVPNVDSFLSARLASNRYRLSLVLAIYRDAEARKMAGRLSGSAREAIERGLSDVIDAIGRNAGALGGGSTDRFFEIVLRYWSDRSSCAVVDSDCVDRALDSYASLEDSRSERRAMKRLIDEASRPTLQEELLRHLAVIAVPMTADVLAHVPRIAEVCGHVAIGRSVDPSAAAHYRHVLVRTALCLLWRRGFALMLLPERADSQIEPRFTVHRSLQRYVYRKLGSQEIEPADAFYFTVSTYASQTRELPALSANGYSFLSQLMDCLISYPSRSNPPPESLLTATRALRAGLGIARTLYSIGVVSRFADLPGIERPNPPKIGYFEHHRLALHWMLERARTIGKLHKGTEPTDPFRLNPFYRDEIAWLYNECGVFSLAQGQLHDAAALLSVAKKIARGIEGEGAGAIGRRIRLNSGLVALERGRLTEARRELDDVIKAQDEDETVRMIATGYMGLADHLTGDHESALQRYGRAIETLEEYRRPRPVSIFRRHLGNLYRHMNAPDKAREEFQRAVATASAAGFQDILWLARVELANLDVHAAVDSTESARLIGELEEADRYADKMDVPRLTCHILAVRAALLLKQGETTRASELATNAVRIATENDMALRTINYRFLLARILDSRSHSSGALHLGTQANSMRLQAMSAARRIGYQLTEQGLHP